MKPVIVSILSLYSSKKENEDVDEIIFIFIFIFIIRMRHYRVIIILMGLNRAELKTMTLYFTIFWQIFRKTRYLCSALLYWATHTSAAEPHDTGRCNTIFLTSVYMYYSPSQHPKVQTSWRRIIALCRWAGM